MEKGAEAWRIIRWVLLLFSIGVFALAVWFVTFTIGIQQDSLANLFPKSQPASRPTGQELPGVLISVRLEFTLMAVAFTQFWIAGMMLGSVLGNWRRGKRDALYAKVLHCCLEKATPEPHEG
jgi:hypothetical protein